MEKRAYEVRRYARLNREEIELIKALRADGMKIGTLATKFEVSWHCINRALKKEGQQ